MITPEQVTAAANEFTNNREGSFWIGLGFAQGAGWAIEQVRAEIEQGKALWDNAKAGFNADLDALRAENARLRDEIEKAIVAIEGGYPKSAGSKLKTALNK